MGGEDGFVMGGVENKAGKIQTREEKRRQGRRQRGKRVGEMGRE